MHPIVVDFSCRYKHELIVFSVHKYKSDYVNVCVCVCVDFPLRKFDNSQIVLSQHQFLPK